jgi:outer membrane protein TolC
LLPWAAPLYAQRRAVTLQEAVELALRSHPAVVQARGQVTVAGASKRETIGNWLPVINGSSSWSRNSATRFDPTTQRNVSAPSKDTYSAGLNASIQLFDGFRRFAQRRSANANLASADAALVSQQFQGVLQTKQAFFNAMAADELVRVAQTRIERAEQQLKISKDKLAAGSATRSDTLRGRVELANAQLQMLNAETQRATAEANLARLIGVDGTVRAVPEQDLFAPVVIDTARLRDQALAHSPAVRQAQAEAEAAGAQLAINRAQYLPTVSASYSNSLSGQGVNQLDNSWSLRLNLTWPLFNGFTRETAIARSNANRDAALAQAEDARRLVNAQLTQQLAALTAAQARLEIAQASRAAAAEDLRVQQERYRLGVATIVDVLTTQLNLDQAEVDIVQARLDYLTAKAQIEALIGREL